MGTPPIWLRHTGGECDTLFVTVAVFFNPSVLRTPPLYFAAQITEEEGEMYFPFASAPILYVTPCNVTGHGRGGFLRHSFIM